MLVREQEGSVVVVNHRKKRSKQEFRSVKKIGVDRWQRIGMGQKSVFRVQRRSEATVSVADGRSRCIQSIGERILSERRCESVLVVETIWLSFEKKVLVGFRRFEKIY